MRSAIWSGQSEWELRKAGPPMTDVDDLHAADAHCDVLDHAQPAQEDLAPVLRREPAVGVALSG